MKKQVLALLATLLAGCGSSRVGAGMGGQGGTGGHPDQGGAPGMGTGGAGGTGGSASNGGAPGPLAECLEHPAASAVATVPITVRVELSHSGNPVTFGEPFAIDGGTLTLTNFRFYISSAALRLRAGGDVPVDLVGGDGAPAPYGTVLVNAEDPSAMTFQIAAPAGDYSGLSFLVGIPDVCNGGPEGRSPPLSAASQMTWPLPFGYLFLRYAGTRGAGTLADAVPVAIDMGGFPGHIFAPRIQAASDLKIEAARTLRLTVALEQLFRAASMPAELDDYARALSGGPTSGPAQMNGQYLLHNLGVVAPFTITAAP